MDAAWSRRGADWSAPAAEPQERVHHVLPLHAGVQELRVVADQGWGSINHVRNESFYMCLKSYMHQVRVIVGYLSHLYVKSHNYAFQFAV